MIKKTLHGPSGAKLYLDSTQYFPDDPGEGTPALIEYKGETATFECGRNEGEVGCGVHQLPPKVLDWLWSPEVEAEVDKLYVLVGG